jgi:2-amino-4-hydroxy-6-hydroxymethyldihydropteridine diphosphokinase
MRRVAFGLGANLGDRVAALQGAVDLIAPHLRDPRVSSVYETAPVGGPEQPDYANAVLVGESPATPIQLLGMCHSAERVWHRTREIHWGPRTLDVDILAVGELVSDDPVLTLPHPRAAQRGFVLVPWAEVDPDAVLPDGRRVLDLATEFSGHEHVEFVRRRTDVVLVVPDQ